MTPFLWALVGLDAGLILKIIYLELTMPRPQWVPYISNITAPSVAELNAGTYKDGAA